jgi:glycosyltransferase involved in cell wall biosynthesis
MNICIITSSFPSHPDDVAQAPFLADFIRGLIRRGHQVSVFTQDREGPKEEFLNGATVRWFPWSKSAKPLVQLNPYRPSDLFKILSLFFNGRKNLFLFLKENKVETCLALWILPGGYFANQAFRQAKIPYSIWSLGSDMYQYGKNPILYPMMKRIIQEAKAVFADGFDLSKRIEERFGRRCSFLATTRTIRNSGPDGPDNLQKPERPDKPYRFLFVGRIEKVKGIDLLLQSMASLKEEGMNAHLTVAGRGGMEEWAKAFIEARDLGGNVSWVGDVSDPALASLYESCDCVVIPSRSESIPLVFSEAIRFNKKLIVTDVGDMGTLGRQHGVAWVVPAEDAMALREMMKKRALLKDNGNEEKEEAEREGLKRLFDLETSVERFLADYV